MTSPTTDGHTPWLYNSNEPMLKAIPIKGDDIWEMILRNNDHYMPMLARPPLAVSPFTYVAIDLKTNKEGRRLLVHVSLNRDEELMDRFYNTYFKKGNCIDVSPKMPSEMGAKYMYLFQFFEASDKEMVIITPSHVCFLDEVGNLKRYPGELGGAWMRTLKDIDGDYEARKDRLRQLVHFTLFCFSLMNCKNTILINTDAPQEDQRERMRKMGVPFVTYRTIKINQTLIKNEGSLKNKSDSSLKRLHMCRGNFARYSEEKPLFGKYPGLFFRPQHIRGNFSAGLSIKNYEIGTE